MRAIAYTRVSTEEQTNEGVSLAAQSAKIASWAEFNGYEIVGRYTDAGMSGSKADRPGLTQALTIISKGDALVTYSLSRLSRSTHDMLSIASKLNAIGADLVSITERIDTTSASGRMVFRMMAVLNEFEREQLVERTRSALQYKRSRGERIGAINYGMRLAKDGKTLVADEKEQQIIAKAQAMRNSEQLGLRQIVKKLTMQGYKSRSGKPFDPTQIARMCRKA